MTDDQPVQFDARSARRIIAAVRRLEAMTGSTAPAFRTGVQTYGIVRARVTTAIPTGSWDVPSSSGRAQIRHKDATGAWADSGDPVVVWNDNTMPSSIPAGRVVKLSWIDGEWWLNTGSCT